MSATQTAPAPTVALVKAHLAAHKLDMGTVTPGANNWSADVYATLRGNAHLMGRVLVMDSTGVPFFEFGPWPGAGSIRAARWDAMRAHCGDDNATSRRSGYLVRR